MTDSNSQNRKFDIVLFDLGHTLLMFDARWPDVADEGARQLVGVLQDAGLAFDKEAFIEELHRRNQYYYSEREGDFIEYSTEYILCGLLHDYGYEDVPAETVRAAIDAMYAVSQSHWHLEDDATAMLDQLKAEGYSLGLISNASDNKDVQTLVDNGNLRDYFDIIIVSAAAGIRKPDPRIFRIALDQWNAEPQRAVMVGDTLNADVLGAHNAGMAGIWITRRGDRPDNHAVRDRIQPDATIGTLSELPGLLSSWNGSGPR